MKENSVNESGRLKGSVLKSGTEKVLGSNGSRTIQAGRVALLAFALMAFVLFSGCASVPGQGSSDPWQYNPSTGYPAVGGPPWRL